MKAYCINLDRRPDRLDYMTAQFAQAGLPFLRIPAVDGQSPEAVAAAAACSIGMAGRRMSAGAYGCFQSHREVWRRLIASGEDHALVFEDDLILAPGLAACLDPGWVPPDADLVRLETNLSRVHCQTGPGLPALGRSLHRLWSRHAGTGGYVIAARAAARLLQATGSVTDPVDEYLFNEASPAFAGLVIYQMVPAPVIQGAKQDPAAAGWGASSISERFAPGEDPGLVGQETLLPRLRRRLQEEWRALRRGTRYVVVPFG